MSTRSMIFCRKKQQQLFQKGLKDYQFGDKIEGNWQDTGHILKQAYWIWQ